MKKRILALLLAGVLLVGSAGAAFTATKTYTPGQFTDVAANAWYAASVKKVFELNLMNGSSATTFNPGGMFTVAEALTVAARMHSLSHGGNGVLPTASGAWYQNAVDYCIKNKLITADQFDSYTRSATRAEMAGVIRAALPDDQWKAINSVSALPDVNMGNEYAQAIFDLYNAGVFTGSDDYGMFQPYAYITRAEVAAIVARCADPSQRKTLNLKPLSQRQAPELLGGYQSRKMSNGRLAYQDPTSKKWGYLDGNGNAVIPAQYDYVENFEGGYAKVRKNDKYGLINTAGVTVVPVEQDRLIRSAESSYDPAIWFATKNGKTAIVNNGRLATGYAYDSIQFFSGVKDVYAVCQNEKWGVVNSAGGTIVSIKYPMPLHGNAVDFNGVYGFGYPAEGGVDLYDLNNKLLGHFAEDPTWADGNPLLAVKEGNKYAVATPKGKITEAMYDSVRPLSNTNFAEVTYGDLTGFASLNGVIFQPEKCKLVEYSDEFISVTVGSGLKVLDETGVKEEFDAVGGCLRYGDYFFNEHYHRVSDSCGDLFDATGKLVADYERVTKYDHLDLVVYGEGYGDDSAAYVVTREGKYGPYQGISQRKGMEANWEQSNYGTYLRCENPDETYDVFDQSGNRIMQGGYPSSYAIRQSDAGKPIVAYGNDTTGWTPVIEFYKNNMYYDEIADLGEGYYACRFNTTWYLLHA